MRIAVSLLNFRPGCIGGAETYIRQLIPAMVELKGDDELVLVAFRDNAREIDTAGITTAVVNKTDRQMIGERCLEAFTFYRSRAAERIFREIAPDVVLFPQQSVFPKAIKYPAVVTIVDLQHLFLPQNFSLFDRVFRAAIYPYSLRRAQHLIAISQFTKRTLMRRYGFTDERISAIPLGFGSPDATRPPTSPRVPLPYVYYPAATFPHKNHAELFRAVAKLHEVGEFPYKLVLSGMQTGLWRRLESQIRQLALNDVVVHLGFLSYGEVCSLYANADAVVFPSRYEGFGLPVLEAVAFGRKVIVSRLEIFQELGVPTRFCIDFADPEQLRRALSERGPTVLEKPVSTWRDCAAQTLTVLRRVATKGCV